MKIERVRVTPIAIKDPPLLNVMGIHQPFALRSVIEVFADSGLVGIAETYGDTNSLNGLKRVGEGLVGMDPFHLNATVAPRRRGPERPRGSSRPDPGARHPAGTLPCHRLRGLRDRLHGPSGPAHRPARRRASGRPGARRRALQLLSLLQEGPSFRRRRGRFLRPRRNPRRRGRAGQALCRRIRFHVDQAQGRRLRTRRRNRDHTAIEGRLSGPSAAPRPQRRLDRRNRDQGHARTVGRAGVHGRPGARLRGERDRRPRRRHAHRHQHDRGRLPRPAGFHPPRFGAGHPVGPSLLGRAVGSPCTWPGSARPGAWGCPCTPIPISASAWRP